MQELGTLLNSVVGILTWRTPTYTWALVLVLTAALAAHLGRNYQLEDLRHAAARHWPVALAVLLYAMLSRWWRDRMTEWGQQCEVWTGPWR